MKRHEIREIMQNRLKKFEVPCEVFFDYHDSNVMYYDPEDKKMCFNPDVLVEYKNSTFPNLQLEECVQIILAHELGHYIDHLNNPEKLNQLLSFKSKDNDYYEYRYESEITAWRNGIHYVEEYLHDYYDYLNQENLQRIMKSYEK